VVEFVMGGVRRSGAGSGSNFPYWKLACHRTSLRIE
jgi:hypothetical protein